MAALKISGRVGNFDFINETYEPMQGQHNGKPLWVARAVAPRYLFWSGKSRWVISKWQNDGTKCFAFVSGEGSQSPGDLTGWQVCDSDGTWREDSNMRCQSVPANNDMFAKLRLTLDGEMKALGLTDKEALKPLWRRLDYNGNNIVSLAEIDKLVVEMVKGQIWPEWLNNKPALMRAYKKTIHMDGDGDAWVEKKEFHALLLNIFWFNRLWAIFHKMAAVEERTDRRIDFSNFCEGMAALGLGHLDRAEAQSEFQKMDLNGGGQVLFVEFCAYVRNRVNPDHLSNFDADIVSGTDASVHMRKSHGNKGTHAYHFSPKTMRCFDDLEKKILKLTRMRPKMARLWKRIDYNGDGHCSLGELDKMCANEWPLLNHKPALQKAYKAACEKSGGDDKIQKKEFKCLLTHMFYFNKIMWLYNQVDNDRSKFLELKDFKNLMLLCGRPMPEPQASQTFRELDRDGRNGIDFDEFVGFFTRNEAPGCMEKLVD